MPALIANWGTLIARRGPLVIWFVPVVISGSCPSQKNSARSMTETMAECIFGSKTSQNVIL
jgi:hypothetical protein